MRVRKTIKIDDREITIKELTVRDIITIGDSFANGLKAETTGFDELKKVIKNHFSVGIEGLDFDALLDLAPSELDCIYQAFKEVNSVFFQLARQAGLTEILETIKQAIKLDFLKSLAPS